MSKKYNDLAKWVVIAIAIGTIIYNTLVTHVVLKNDVRHLETAVKETKQEVRDLRNYLLTEK